MRLNFLQLAREELARARTMARYLGVSEAQSVGMVLLLKAAALEVAPEDDLTGTIHDPAWGEWVAASVGWDMTASGVLAAAMARCGFVMALPSGAMCVAGLDVYAKGKKTSTARSEAGKAGAAKRWGSKPDGKPMANDAGAMATDSNIEKEIEKEIGSAASQRAPAEAAPPPEGLPPTFRAEAPALEPEVEAHLDAALREETPPAPTPARRQPIQPVLVPVPPTPPRGSTPRKPLEPKTTEEERAAKARVESTYLEVMGEKYPWGAEDWAQLRLCLGPDRADGDLEKLDERWACALRLGARYPGCAKLRQLASNWGALLPHLRPVEAPPRKHWRDAQAEADAEEVEATGILDVRAGA